MPRHAPFQKGNQFGKGHGRPKKRLVCWAEALTQEEKDDFVRSVYEKALQGDGTAMTIIANAISGHGNIMKVDKLDTQADVDKTATDIFVDWTEGDIKHEEAKTGYDLLMKKRDTIDSAKNERIQIELDGLRQDKGNNNE